MTINVFVNPKTGDEVRSGDSPRFPRGLVRLTSQGRTALRTIQTAQAAWADALGAELGQADLQQASVVLDRVLQALQTPELSP